MEKREEDIKNKTKFAPKSTSLFKNEEIKVESFTTKRKTSSQINNQIDQAIHDHDVKTLRSLSSEMMRETLKKMRTYHPK